MLRARDEQLRRVFSESWTGDPHWYEHPPRALLDVLPKSGRGIGGNVARLLPKPGPLALRITECALQHQIARRQDHYSLSSQPLHTSVFHDNCHARYDIFDNFLLPLTQREIYEAMIAQSVVLGSGLRLSLTGIAIGLIGSRGLLRSIFPEYPAADPTLLVLIVLLVVIVSMLACWLPAQRATRVNPIDALRSE